MTTQPHSFYHLTTWQGLLPHYGQRVTLVRDSDDTLDEAEMLLRARVRSGDYFMTLATELEQLADSLAVSKQPEAIELERIAAELLALNRRYIINEK